MYIYYILYYKYSNTYSICITGLLTALQTWSQHYRPGHSITGLVTVSQAWSQYYRPGHSVTGLVTVLQAWLQ